MNGQDKLAIENLIIISRYMEDNSVLTTDDEKVLRDSIERAEALIGLPSAPASEEIELNAIGEFDIDSIIKALRNRNNS